MKRSYVPDQPFVLPPALSKRYEGDRFVSRMPFLMNADVDDEETAIELSYAPIHADQLFMGISGFRSLDLLSTAGSDTGETYRQAVLFDNNEGQTKAMNGILHLVAHCETPEAFQEAFKKEYRRWIDHVPKRHYGEGIKSRMEKDPKHKLHAQLKEDANYFGIVGRSLTFETEEELQDYFHRSRQHGHSWLQPENYERIRQLALHHRIATVTLDLTDQERFDILSRDLKSQGYRLGDMYLSSSLPMLAQNRSTTYHSKSRGKQTLSKNDMATACDNLLKLGTDDSRFLVSDVGLGVFNHKKSKSAFRLVAANSGQIAKLRMLSNEFMAEGTAEDMNYIDCFGVGKKTFSAQCTVAHIDPHYALLQERIPDMAADDFVLFFSPSSKPRTFTAGEKNAVRSVMRQMSNGYDIDFILMQGGKPAMAEYYLIRLPAAMMKDKPEMIDAMLEGLKAGMQSANAHLGRS